jgi:drug/metabolite transporter (DMT)-like permease
MRLSDVAVSQRAKPSTALSGSADSPTRAVLCLLFGCALLTAHDALMKWLLGAYPLGQVWFLRGGVALALALLVAAMRRELRAALHVTSWRDQAIRAGCANASGFLFTAGLGRLPLADCIAIGFASPLFITALAAPLLGERVGWRRWLAVLLGFAGVMLIVKPTGDAFHWAAFLPLSAALFGALRDLQTRRMGRTETSQSILIYSTLLGVLAGLATTPFAWEPPAGGDIALILLAGVVVCGGHFLLIEGFRSADAAFLAPLKYSTLVWGAIFGYALWRDVPAPGIIAGAALVILAGIYVVRQK